jgi:hypothetical protein
VPLQNAIGAKMVLILELGGRSAKDLLKLVRLGPMPKLFASSIEDDAKRCRPCRRPPKAFAFVVSKDAPQDGTAIVHHAVYTTVSDCCRIEKSSGLTAHE